MDKQAKTLAVLGAVLVLCGGVYGALRIWNGRQEAPDETVHVTEVSDISGLSFTANDGEVLSFTKNGDDWSWDGDAAFPADADKLDALADDIGELDAVRAIPDPEALSAYGLDAPTRTASVTGADGETVTVLLGSSVDEGCYAAVEGDEGTVYTISSALPDALDVGLMDLAQPEDIPDLTEDDISSIRWEKDGTVLTLAKTDEAVTTEDEDGNASESVEHHWSVDGEPVPDGNSALSSFLSELSYLRFSSCYHYQADEAAMASCGLDAPALRLTVDYGDGQSLTLDVGLADGDGTYRFARLEGSDAIQRLPATTAEVLEDLSRESLLAAPDSAS